MTTITTIIKNWFQVGFTLGVLMSCAPSSSNPKTMTEPMLIDPRNFFEGTWCWTNHVVCGSSDSRSKTSVTILKSEQANEVTLLGFTGVVTDSRIILSLKMDSYGGACSGMIERKGALLEIKISIYYADSGITCFNSGTAVLSNDCL